MHIHSFPGTQKEKVCARVHERFPVRLQVVVHVCGMYNLPAYPLHSSPSAPLSDLSPEQAGELWRVGCDVENLRLGQVGVIGLLRGRLGEARRDEREVSACISQVERFFELSPTP